VRVSFLGAICNEEHLLYSQLFLTLKSYNGLLAFLLLLCFVCNLKLWESCLMNRPSPRPKYCLPLSVTFRGRVTRQLTGFPIESEALLKKEDVVADRS